jgi:hypothetical protein
MRNSLNKRLRILDSPYAAVDENGDRVMIKANVFAYSPDESGWVEIEQEGRIGYRVRMEILEAHTHLAS